MQNKVASMEALVERLQGSQKRESGDSNSLHVMRVRTLLMNALAAAKENADDAQVIELAALGHDLLEDTGVTGDEFDGVPKISKDSGYSANDSQARTCPPKSKCQCPIVFLFELSVHDRYT